MKKISKPVEHRSPCLKTKFLSPQFSHAAPADVAGQATLEYILLLMIIIGAALVMFQGVRGINMSEKLASPIEGDYAHAYQLGHPKAEYKDGQYKLHPRMGNASGGAIQGRIFIYLGAKK